MTENLEPAALKTRRRRYALPLMLLCLLALGAISLYEIRSPGGKKAVENIADEQACLASRKAAERIKPLIHGEVAALILSEAPKPVSKISFHRPDGSDASLEDFAGKTLLLNLWATWCVPCRQEMPALDRLQAQLGSPNFEVVAVNIDTARLDKPNAFLDEIGVKSLTRYADSKAEIFQTLRQAGKVLGLPTTMLVGKDGCEIATMAGPAQWDSAEAQALIKAVQEF
ncbi:thiol:disulfide interchange protein TlpA [Beijerinckia indica]|uniref:Redoxin domain protein n=1 Tax=Beijerinckia indica subsp. indica (strain ATCC 9039 / DSM 1715 / NCIMB 8712) TaxID=395963 RepID=B2IG95_BEII9|nr:TlpA disulfide reductase family protein [Beijerinckia indica]ACB97169.1 Redoxin domain protein [Beijerinckia indica subsp. indica ATCC 9039]